MNEDPSPPAWLPNEGVLVTSIEDHHVVFFSPAPEYRWVRVYSCEGFLRNSYMAAEARWIWYDHIPEPVKQFAENYARLIL